MESIIPRGLVYIAGQEVEIDTYEQLSEVFSQIPVGTIVRVTDASGDPKIPSGWAKYERTETGWEFISSKALFVSLKHSEILDVVDNTVTLTKIPVGNIFQKVGIIDKYLDNGQLVVRDVSYSYDNKIITIDETDCQ